MDETNSLSTSLVVKEILTLVTSGGPSRLRVQ